MILADLNPTVPPYKQSLQTLDRAGNVIFADDTNGGEGLAWPLLSVAAFVDIASTTLSTTTSASYEDLQWGAAVRQHPRCAGSLLVISTVAGTTGNVRVVDGAGNQIGATIPVSSLEFQQVTLGPVAWPAGTWEFGEGIVNLRVQAERTTGTGAIGAKCLGLWGYPS
jgi:hypothetical protein